MKPALLRNMRRPLRKTVRRSGSGLPFKDSLTDVRFPFKMYLNLFSKIAV